MFIGSYHLQFCRLKQPSLPIWMTLVFLFWYKKNVLDQQHSTQVASNWVSRGRRLAPAINALSSPETSKEFPSRFCCHRQRIHWTRTCAVRAHTRISPPQLDYPLSTVGGCLGPPKLRVSPSSLPSSLQQATEPSGSTFGRLTLFPVVR